MASLAVKNLFHDRVRLAVTIVGIVFSVVLVAMQAGLFMGFTSTTANIIDHSGADIWIMSKGVPFIEAAPPFPEQRLFRVRALADVVEAQKYIVQFSMWQLPNGSHENCEIVGFNPDGTLGGPWNIVEGSVDDLRLPYTVMIDRFYAERLGATHIGDIVEIARTRARVVGFTSGIRTFTTTPLVFTSIRNASAYTGIPDTKAQFVLVRTRPGTDIKALTAVMTSELSGVDVWSREEFAARTTNYWMFGTGAGIAVIAGGLLGLLVGVVIVAQTIYAATMDHLREFGTLKAIGASNWFVYRVIFTQAVISAVIGYAIAVVIAMVLATKGQQGGANIVLSPPMWVALFILTVVMCLTAATVSIRKVMKLDPAMVFKG